MKHTIESNMQAEFIKCIQSFKIAGDRINNCAVDLCVADISILGYKHWMGLPPKGVAEIFYHNSSKACSEFVDQVKARQAGQNLLQSVPGVVQEQLDVLEEAKNLALASSEVFKVFIKYLSIREDFLSVWHYRQKNNVFKKI